MFWCRSLPKWKFLSLLFNNFYVHLLQIFYLWSSYQCSADFLLYVFKIYLKSNVNPLKKHCLDVWKLLLHHCWGLHPCFCSTSDLNWETLHTTVCYIINSLLPCKCCILSVLAELPARAICYRPSFIWYIIQMPSLYKHIEMSDRVVLLWLDPEHWQTNPHVDKLLSVWTRQLPQWRKLLNKSITSQSNVFMKAQLFLIGVFRLLNQKSAFALSTNLLPEKN